MPENLQAILLAGGKSIRFNTQKTKLTEKICGKEMILYPLELLKRMHIPTTIVVGFEKEKIVELLKKNNMYHVSIAVQEEQLGTGHAVKISQNFWNQNHILIINGDIPLINAEVIEKLYTKHTKSDADISFVTAHYTDETDDSYCRVIIHDNKMKVIEPRNDHVNHLNKQTQCCVSVGIYIIKKSFLEHYIDTLTKSSVTQEFYLPELIQIASENQGKIITIPTSFELARTVNTLSQLWVVEHIKRSQIISYWMNHGVRFASSLHVIIDHDVILEPGVFIGFGVHLLGKTVVKKNAKILAFAYIKDSIIEENAHIEPHTIIYASKIEREAIINSFTKVNYEHIEKTKAPKQKNINSLLFTGAIKDEIKINTLDIL